VKYHLRRGVGLIKFLKMVLDPSPPPLLYHTDVYISSDSRMFSRSINYIRLFYIHISSLLYICIVSISYRSVHLKWFKNILSLHILHMGGIRLVGSLKLDVSFAKEPHKRADILQKRRIILRSLLIVATPYLVPHIAYVSFI